MSEPTSLPVAVVADTIVRTVELGVTITDAAVDGEITVVFCDLLDDGRPALPGVRQRGHLPRHRDPPGYRCAGGRASAAAAGAGAAVPLHAVTVIGKCSPTTPTGWRAAAGRPPGGVPATSCAG